MQFGEEGGGMGLRISARMPLREFDLSLELEVGTGECLALAGPWGAGKTPLLRIAAGLMRPPSGRVAIGEEVWLDTAAGHELPAERRRCGFVFQDYALFPNLSAWRNVAFGMRGPRRGRRRPAAGGVGGLGGGRPA